MQAYIHHRLEVAGASDRQIFAEDTYPEIYRYTGGVPRLVNTLCDTAMLAAFGMDRDHVLLEDIINAVQELRWPEYRGPAQLHGAACGALGSDGPHRRRSGRARRPPE